MSSIHCQLVHVVLSVRSVTSDGIIVIAMNSPKLITFRVFMTGKVFYDGESACDF